MIGAAELAGDITTRDMSTFLFNNIYLYEGGTLITAAFWVSTPMTSSRGTPVMEILCASMC